jgi:Ca2+-binding RTX toxin-like protein
MRSRHPAVLFVDTAVPDREILLAGVDPRTKIVPLSPAGDPIGQISDVLADFTGIESLSILSHGAPGQLHLAGRVVDLTALSEAAPHLLRIKAALTPDAEVTLVACASGAGTAGAQFTDGLEDALGVPVHAASAPLGGDAGWHALPSAATLFSAEALATYAHRLATLNGSGIGDTILGTAAADELNGLAGNDVISGFGGNDTIDGGADNDQISGGTGVDSLLGDTGDDTFFITSGDVAGGAETINGGAGTDIISLTGGGSFDFSGATVSVETITGGTGADTITGTTAADLIDGGAAADIISGHNGNDTLSGGAGADTIDGGAGDDRISGGTGVDSLLGGDGFDTFFIASGDIAGGAETIDGGNNSDILSLTGGGSFDFSGATISVETINGGGGADTVTGSTDRDVIHGGNGDDVLSGHDGNDDVFGQGGNDTLYGGDGNDLVRDNSGDNVLYGDAGNDTLSGTGSNDTLYGGTGNDSLIAGSGNSLLDGGAGNDTIQGSQADLNGDTLTGVDAGDTLLVLSKDLSSLNGTSVSSSIDLGDGNTLNLSLGNYTATLSATESGGHTTIGFTLNAIPVYVDRSIQKSDRSAGDIAGTETSFTLSNTGNTAQSGTLLSGSGSGNNVTVTLPGRVSATVNGPASSEAPGTATGTLDSQVQGTGSTDSSFLALQGSLFLDSLGTGANVDVRTIAFSGDGITTPQTIEIRDQFSSSGVEAFIFDMSGLPAGSTLVLNDIDFAIVIGNVTVNSSGNGPIYLAGDSSAQTVSLGDLGDTVAAGGGADTVDSGNGEDLVYGNQGDDSLLGGDGKDTFFGGQDQDSIDGGNDSDILFGNKGEDTLSGGEGSDILYGNQGNDTLFGDDGKDTLFGGQDQDSINAGNDSDILYGNKGEDTLSGGEGSDLLYGGQGSDIVYGNQGDDSLNGDLGNDILFGGQGNDIVNGGEGADRLAGNKGADTLVGGDGADTFIFGFSTGNDQVSDFTVGTDSLQFDNGLTYTAQDSGGNTLLTLSDGGTVTLIGVSKSEFDIAATAGWGLA